VQIGADQRIPLVDQSQHRLHLGRLALRVVAIEVHVLRRRAPARLLRAVLIRPIPASDALVTVRVESRHEQHRDLIEQMRRRRAQELSQSDEARVLAVALAWMDAALEHEQRNCVLPQRLCSPRAFACDEQRAHRPAFGRVTVDERVDSVRPARNERCGKRFDFIEPAGLTKVSVFGNGEHRSIHVRYRRTSCQPEHAESRPNRAGAVSAPGLSSAYI
jgi:hypothetical protein